MPLFDAKMAVYANGKYATRTRLFVDNEAAAAIGIAHGNRFLMKQLDDEYYELRRSKRGFGAQFRRCAGGRNGLEISFGLGEPATSVFRVRVAVSMKGRFLVYKGARASAPAPKPRIRVRVISRPISWDAARVLVMAAEARDRHAH